MRYRIATAETAKVLPTLDGPLAVEAGEVVLVAVMASAEEAADIIRSLSAAETVRRKLYRGKR